MILKKLIFHIFLVFIGGSIAFGQGFGSAVITSVPDSADVYIDGYRFGKTPFEANSIVPGKYQVSLSKTGFEPRKFEMVIEGEKRFDQKIFLFPEMNSYDTLLASAEENDIKEDTIGVGKPLEIKKHMKVNYPRYIKYYGIEGKVYLHILIGRDGKAERADILKSSGAFCLDYEAVRSVPSISFEPGIDTSGKPFRTWIVYPVNFVLK